QKVLTEGTLLGWANSLMELSYSFIDDFLRRSSIRPPFPIPRLRFVRGCIAYSLKPVEASGQAPPTSHRAVYLLEELIDTASPFIKYIHNGDATPLQEEGEAGYEMGVFLCFIQHLQYSKTYGQAYLSDFQGAGNLLTDPQIMSLPRLLEENQAKHGLFGEGNVGTAFEAFTMQHLCNKYCEWFKLDALSAVTASGTKPSAVGNIPGLLPAALETDVDHVEGQGEE
ncbi:hypothetical protein CPC08DRAFT_650400, partial [Agrocybe pediades]